MWKLSLLAYIGNAVWQRVLQIALKQEAHSLKDQNYSKEKKQRKAATRNFKRETCAWKQ